MDYNAIATASIQARTVKLPPCHVRVDIYNGLVLKQKFLLPKIRIFLDRTKKLQNRTFDSATLITDISKFVSSADTESASRILILSSFDDRENGKNCVSFKGFAKYNRKIN